MSDKVIDNRFDPVDTRDTTSEDTDISPENTDALTDNDPVDTVLVHEETIVYADPLDQPIPANPPLGEANAPVTPVSERAMSSPTLLKQEDLEHFRSRWNEVQSKFVDEPRAAVQQADALVSEVIMQISQMIILEQNSLASQWKQDKDVSTEGLRIALKNYRSFFNRLVIE